jgi:hypothetical protein
MRVKPYRFSWRLKEVYLVWLNQLENARGEAAIVSLAIAAHTRKEIYVLTEEGPAP